MSAGAEEIRLVVVGDTGEDTAMARVVSAAVAAEANHPGPTVTRIIATGDLYYDRPPSERSIAECASVVSDRYRQFYTASLPQPVLAVVGNHDVYPPGDGKAFSFAAHACTEAAFRQMGWLDPDETLQTRVVAVDGAEVTADVALVDWRLLGPTAEALAARVKPEDLRPDATFRIGVSHYPLPQGLTTGKCKEFEWNAELPDTVPGVDLWLNGHSHHLEARMTRGALNVTSGAGKELDELEVCSRKRSFYRVTSEDPTPVGPAAGGFTVIDLDSTGRFAVTPWGCTVERGCAALTDEALACTAGKARVRCASAQ